MKQILSVVSLVGGMLVAVGCQPELDAVETVGTARQEQLFDLKIRHRGHVALAPGLEKIFADQANIFFNESAQADRAVFAAELKGRLAAGEVLYVVDVRDQTSYQEGHLPQAVNVPIETLFTDAAREPFPDDGTPVIFVCANGHVSSMAAALYGTMGYNAYALRFGMIGWRRSTAVQVYSNAQTPQAITGLNGPIVQ